MSPITAVIYVHYDNSLTLAMSARLGQLLGNIHWSFHVIIMQMNRYRDLIDSMDKLENFYALPEIDQTKMIAKSEDSDTAIKIASKSFTWGVKTKTDKQIKKEKKDEKEKKEKEGVKKVEDESKDEKKDDDKENEKPKLSELTHLKDINLDIKKGEFICVIGKTGSGKTNLMSALLGEMFNIDEQLVNSLGGSEKELSTEDDRRVFMNNVLGHNNTLPSPPICVNGSIAYSQQTPWI